MKKLIISIIVFMPFFLMYTVSSIGRVMANFRYVPVEAIYFVDEFEELILSNRVYTISVGDQFITKTKLIPNFPSNSNVVYSIENDAIASVDENGVVTGLSVGETTLFATSVDGHYRAQLGFEVIASIEGIYVDNVVDNSLTMFVQTTFKLIVRVELKTFPDKRVNLTSSNEAVATVKEDGTINAKAVGTTVIKITAVADKNIFIEIDLQVFDNSPFKIKDNLPNYNFEYSSLIINQAIVNITDLLYISDELLENNYKIVTEVNSSLVVELATNQYQFLQEDMFVEFLIHYYQDVDDLVPSYTIALFMKYVM